MSIADISKRYAKALFAVSKESNQHKETLQQILAVSKAIDQVDVQNFLLDPHVDSENKKRAIIKTLEQIRVSDIVKNFILLLIDRHRFLAISEIVKSYELLIDDDLGITKGEILSAKPIAPEAIASLEAKISNILKKKIVLKFKEDPGVLGGVIARVGGWTFNDSLDLHARKLQEQLLNH